MHSRSHFAQPSCFANLDAEPGAFADEQRMAARVPSAGVPALHLDCQILHI